MKATIGNKSSRSRKLVFIFTFGFMLFVNSVAQSFESVAKSALVVDNLSGMILLEKNITKRIPPASMSKLMTLYMVFDAIRDERILLTDIIRVSKNASQKGGSKMFLNEGQKVSIENIIRGIIIHSGNDACIAIAEALSGTENEFAKDMNKMAKNLGLINSSFTNSTGWPDKDHYMSAVDLINIASRIRTEFPFYYKYFSEKNFTWNNIKQENRNPLLQKGLGADGFKTGHTEEAGYGLVGSAKRGNRRVTFIISGLKTNNERTIEAEKILNWAYRDFKAKRIVKKNQIIGRVPVWLGKKKDVAVVSNKDIFVTLPISQTSTIKTIISYRQPMEAPFDVGQKTPAKLKIVYTADSKNISKEYNLLASESSQTGSFLTRISATLIIFKNHIMRLVQ